MSIIEEIYRIREAKAEALEFHLWFDGGSTCNVPKWGYGEGYGSYTTGLPDKLEKVVRVKFGKGHSANSAEIRTMVEGMNAIANAHPDVLLILHIHGDSQIALNRVSGKGPKKMKKKWKPPTENFVEAIRLMEDAKSRFHTIHTHWHPREKSVALFGH